MSQNDSEDFIESLKRRDAADAARERAIAPAQKGRGRVKTPDEGGYAEAAFQAELEAVKSASEGSRNNQLNTSAFNLGQLVGAGVLNEDQVRRELYQAARAAGLKPSEIRGTVASGIQAGMQKPRDMSDVGTQPKTHPGSHPKTQPETQPQNGDEFAERTVKLIRLSTVKSRVPTWVWEHNNIGRIQLGTLTMFAGKPAAGKSTAVRWFAARLSRGELTGVWHNVPMRVAVLMMEEQTDAVVVPGLQVCGANMENVYMPKFEYGDTESGMMSQQDEGRLTDILLDNEIRALFIDPIMSTFSGKADVYRNNEVRAALAPFTRIAEAINGIVVGVTHLRKGEVRDVLGGMNGSSAFGEVPRAVFGFAPLDAGEHVMEQVKNSAGPTGLKLAYKLPVDPLIADDGQLIELPRFEIIGETEVSISDINPNDDETTDISVAAQWLHDYLLQEQPAPSAQTKRDAKQHGDINPWTLKRAMKRLKVVVHSRSEPGKPHTTVWSLPSYKPFVYQPRERDDD